MTKYILHGGFARKDNDSNRSFYEECASELVEGSKVLIVLFASESGDTRQRFETQAELFKAHSKSKAFNFSPATSENFISQAKESDLIYFGGGSTRKLLDALHHYSDLRKLFEDKTVAGSSAGAYSLVSYGASHSEEVVREGLGLVPVRLICHYESVDEPPSAASVTTLQNMAQDLELVILRDCEWRVFRQE